MYADIDTVKALHSNVKSSISEQQYELLAGLVDSDIDARLSRHYYWPASEKGEVLNDPAPMLVRNAATYLLAGLIESRSFAHNEAGTAVANPYASRLTRQGEAILKRLENEQGLVPELVRVSDVSLGAAPQIYSPVTGLRRSR